MERLTYPCVIDGRPAVIDVDLSARAEAPDPGRPVLLYVWIPLLAPTDQGLVTHEESVVLDALEQALATVLAQGGARFVGRIVTADAWQIYWYAPVVGDFYEVVELALGGREHHLGAHEDAAWSHYRDLLCPSDVDLERLLAAGTAPPEA